MRGMIYSDFDGVYNIPQRDGLHTALVATPGSQHFREETTIAWDREILELLTEFIQASGFDFEWLTTWNEYSHIGAAAQGMNFGHMAHAPAQLNPQAKNSKAWTEWKARHILADQRANPRPFIWIDDKAVKYWAEVVRDSTIAPSLIFATDSLNGITKSDLLKMVLWTENLTSVS